MYSVDVKIIDVHSRDEYIVRKYEIRFFIFLIPSNKHAWYVRKYFIRIGLSVIIRALDFFQ